ncbi:VirB3 family type IV secretion system protein [Rhodanobacter sp. 115]|uniref:VirB3 family type IV secretion system protein n=1 Tax=Rhodanobacter sp. FW021-MT20 TaxID=1162282 RepID=UPI0034E4157E
MAATRRISKVYQVLARPKLVAGVDFKFLVLNGAICAIALIVVKFYWWAIPTWIIHKVLQAIARKDALLRPIFMTYSRQTDHYEPWPTTDGTRGMRPRDLGRGAMR